MTRPMQRQHIVQTICDRRGEPKAESVMLGRVLCVGDELNRSRREDNSDLVEILDQRALERAALNAFRL